MISTDLSEDDVTEIALEHDVLDIIDMENGLFLIKTLPKDLTRIKEVLTNDHGKELTIESTELTYRAANPIEIDDEDSANVELFEEKVHHIVGGQDLHMELANVYYNFDQH